MGPPNVEENKMEFHQDEAKKSNHPKIDVKNKEIPHDNPGIEKQVIMPKDKGEEINVEIQPPNVVENKMEFPQDEAEKEQKKRRKVSEKRQKGNKKESVKKQKRSRKGSR